MNLRIRKSGTRYRLGALNVLYWVMAFWIAHSFNVGNEALYGQPIRSAPLYWPAMLGMMAIQAALLYLETGVLLGRFWERGRRWACIAGLLVSWILAANLGVLVIKLVQPQLDVAHFTHVGFMVGPHAPQWTWNAWMDDLGTFLLGYFFWMVIYALAWFTRKFFSQRRLLKQIQLRQAQTELQFLKQQLNPHFLFNTLNNLYGLALQQHAQLPQMLLQLSDLLRYMLYESSTARVPFEKEKHALQSYLQLEQLRLPPDVLVQCTATADADYILPPLLWLPVAENIFKHGCLDTGGKASMIFRIMKGELEIRAINDCNDSGTESRRSGIGLQNLQERLRLLFPERHQLQVYSQGSVFEIHLLIQLLP
ncbi:MAG: histidine kinase [Sphingobacteriales bacterium]|nr:MAG: histidine kinase [Sphingobacteriales bacterium]